MDRQSYYDIACEDLKYLEFTYSLLDQMPNYNAILVQEQQITEKLLKHLINVYMDSEESLRLMHSHKLANILRVLNNKFSSPLRMDDMRFLSEFYFDGRYPSNDYVIATKEDAIYGYEIVQQTKQWVDLLIDYNPVLDLSEFN